MKLEQVSYELALRALDRQDEVLRELRSRTGTLLAASSLVASFLGARAIDRGELGPLSILALLAFLSTILLSVYVLAPSRRLDFELRGSEVFEYFAQRESEIDEVQRTLAYWIDGARIHNQTGIEKLHQSYGAACVALALEVVLWTAELSGTLR